MLRCRSGGGEKLCNLVRSSQAVGSTPPSTNEKQERAAYSQSHDENIHSLKRKHASRNQDDGCKQACDREEEHLF